MSVSISVKGFRSPLDPEHQKHVKVLQFCKEMGVSLPQETAEYFGDDIRIDRIDPDDLLAVQIPFHKVDADDGYNYEVILSEIPQGVNKIRFSNTW
jgi:hypothetical protein